MDNFELQNWSQKMQISPTEVLREEKEILVLNALSQSKLGGKLIFKGGTALRLCYQSPRFSQDLDFNQKKEVKIKELENILSGLTKIQKEIELKDIYDKRKTIFSLLAISHPALKQDFSIKIEISKQDYHLTKKDYSLKTIQSPLSPLTPILYTYTLQRIFLEKKLALKTRSEPRDYFDLWFVAQKLNQPIIIPKPKINPSRFKGEINQLLPKSLENWAKDFLKENE